MNKDINLRNYAHIGDAVWELFVREYTFSQTQNSRMLHKLTIERVNAGYQADLLKFLEDGLSDSEQDIARRARNCSIPAARRNNQVQYRMATSFEALIGYWYINNKPRLSDILELIKSQYFMS